jgi:hypothetical protein
MQWVSNGNGMVGKASIFRLTGVAHKFLLFSLRACLIEVVALFMCFVYYYYLVESVMKSIRLGILLTEDQSTH